LEYSDLAGEEHHRPLTFGGSYSEYVERTGRGGAGGARVAFGVRRLAAALMEF
jgi:hypothetical protein